MFAIFCGQGVPHNVYYVYFYRSQFNSEKQVPPWNQEPGKVLGSSVSSREEGHNILAFYHVHIFSIIQSCTNYGKTRVKLNACFLASEN